MTGPRIGALALTLACAACGSRAPSEHEPVPARAESMTPAQNLSADFFERHGVAPDDEVEARRTATGSPGVIAPQE